MRKPYEYQKQIIANAINRPYTMVQAACGTGKSLIAGQTAIGKGKPTLIITPKNVVADFVEELKADGVDPKDIFVFNALKSHKENYYSDFEHWLLEGVAKAVETDEAEENEEEVIF